MKWREKFDNEELICIINFCYKKIEDIKTFNKKFPLKIIKTIINKDVFCEYREYEIFINGIRENKDVANFVYMELYCWTSMIKDRNAEEENIFEKCKKEIFSRGYSDN